MQVIISLLAKLAIGEDEIIRIVTSRKRNPIDYIRGYNSLNGRRTVSEVAEIIGVSIGTLSPILQDWKSKGIVYETRTSSGVFYRYLLHLNETIEES
jgi:hypothetical protein